MSAGLMVHGCIIIVYLSREIPLNYINGKEEPRLLRVLYSSILSRVLRCRGSLLVLQRIKVMLYIALPYF